MGITLWSSVVTTSRIPSSPYLIISRWMNLSSFAPQFFSSKHTRFFKIIVEEFSINISLFNPKVVVVVAVIIWVVVEVVVEVVVVVVVVVVAEHLNSQM